MRKRAVLITATMILLAAVGTLCACSKQSGGSAKADKDVITVNVKVPDEWGDGANLWTWNACDSDGNVLNATSHKDIVPSKWPGWEMKKATLGDGTEYYTYTIECASMDMCIADAKGETKTIDLVGYATKPGTYWISQIKSDGNGIYECFVSEEKFDGAEVKKVDEADNNSELR